MMIYAIPLVGLLAVWLHELTHVATAWLVGGTVQEINLWDLYVDFKAPSDARERLVLLAPGLVGLAALPVLAALVTTLEGLLVVGFGWGLFTLAGGSEGELRLWDPIQ